MNRIEYELLRASPRGLLDDGAEDLTSLSNAERLGQSRSVRYSLWLFPDEALCRYSSDRSEGKLGEGK